MSFTPLSKEEFRNQYIEMSKQFGLPIPDDTKIERDHENYLTGCDLIVIEPSKPETYPDVQYSKSSDGTLHWSVGPRFLKEAAL